jgi:hypothetical protein
LVVFTVATTPGATPSLITDNVPSAPDGTNAR